MARAIGAAADTEIAVGLMDAAVGALKVDSDAIGAGFVDAVGADANPENAAPRRASKSA